MFCDSLSGDRLLEHVACHNLLLGVEARNPHRLQKHWGQTPASPKGERRATQAPGNSPPGWAGEEWELHEPTFRWLFKRLLPGRGSSQLITAAEATTSGNLKTPPEADSGEEASLESAGQMEASCAGNSSSGGTVPQQRNGSSGWHQTGDGQFPVPRH